MAAPSTPRHKRLAVTNNYGNRASSTPPANRLNSHLLVAMASPLSRHSSPGIDRQWTGRHYADDSIPRRLTASPITRVKDRDRVRKRLTQCHSIDHAVELLKKAKNVVVLTGAGISTSLSIPDFRSDGGFYSKLSAKIGITTPEEFFSVDFFKHESETFWSNVRPLLPRHTRNKNGIYQDLTSESAKQESTAQSTIPKFSSTHAFLSLLQAKSKLLTNYTQNIDGLEYASGVRAEKIIQCHGSWDTATCLTCGKTISAKKYLPIVYQAGYPRCKCATSELAKGKAVASTKTKPKKRKRAVYEGDSDHSSDDGTPSTPKGLYKPDITFFGEPIPESYVPRLEEDKVKADLLLIIGTSLKVRPVKTMLVDFPCHIPQIWINKDRFSGTKSDMPGVHVDIELLGECDVIIEELCRRAEWNLEKFVWQDDLAGQPNRSSTSPSKASTADHNLTVQSRRKSLSISKNVSLTPNEVNESNVRKHNESAFQQNTSIKANGTAAVTTGSTTSTQRIPLPAPSVVSSTTSSVGENPFIKVQSDLDAEWRWRFTKRS